MPYCPKCDMEFIDGITICSDCGGQLLESKEVADAMKKKEQEAMLAKQRAAYEAWQNQQKMQQQAMNVLNDKDSFQTNTWNHKAAAKHASAPNASAGHEDGDAKTASAISVMTTPSAASKAAEAEAPAARTRSVRSSSRVYVKKSQKYDDLKSSATAFLLVGGIALVFSILCWANVISLPMAGFSKILSQGVLTVMGIASLIVAFTSGKSAKEMESQIGDEEQKTKDLIAWFLDSYTSSQIDQLIGRVYQGLEPEELSLKRFEVIQDLIITNKDIADQSYIDLLSEEIYNKLFE